MIIVKLQPWLLHGFLLLKNKPKAQPGTSLKLKGGIESIFEESVISPVPNIESLQFRKKQKYSLAGTGYRYCNDVLYTGLMHHRPVK